MSSAFRSKRIPLLEVAGQQTPAFLANDVAASSPSYGSPYLATSQEFENIFSSTAHRRQLLVEFKRLRQELSLLCKIHATLVGGSIVRTKKRSPRDCDAVFFYSMRPDAEPESVVSGMLEIAERARSRGIDLRLVPVDADPIDLIKAACYFSLLYASDREGPIAKHGSILIVD